MSDEHAAAHRFPWRITAVVVLVVLAASVVIGVLLGRDRVGAGPVESTTPSVGTTASAFADDQQFTALLTVRGADRHVVSAVLLGVADHATAVSELIVPRALLLPTVPAMRLSQVADLSGPGREMAALQTLLGVQIDAVIDLDRLAWTGLIDATRAPVDRALAQQPGSFALVVDRVLAGLPSDAGTASELLTGLGSMARTTVTNEDAGRVLSLVGLGLRANGSDRAVLPVTYIRSGLDRTAVLDTGRAAPLLRGMFPDALLGAGHDGPVRVLVQRAGATVGAELAASARLDAAGMGVLVGPNAPPVGASQVFVPPGRPEAVTTGQQVAAALGLPASAVVVGPVDRPVAAPVAGSDDPPVAGPTTGLSVDARVLLGPDAAVAAG